VIKNADIPVDAVQKNFEVALNALHFQTKVKFKIIEDKRKSARNLKSNIPAPKTATRPKPDDDLMSPDDPKKIYKIQREEGKGYPNFF
jgi:hypothetical protein